MRTLALCAGYGGLELGLELAGWRPDLVAYAETDPNASHIMATHWPDAANLGDLTQITDPPQVDLVTAGFPCQPVSTAGRRKGTEDERWLIEDVCRVASASGAGRLILENVAGLLTANDGDAMARVCQAMAWHGFDRWVWTTVRASDIGACHRRERWFCLAHADGFDGDRTRPLGTGRRPQPPDVGSGTMTMLPTPTASNPNDGESLESWEARRQRNKTKWANGNGQGTPLAVAVAMLPTATANEFGKYADAIARHELTFGREAPPPRNEKGRLSPLFVEWMMGLPEGWVTGTDLSRTQQLRALGNGVVPLQAAHAINQLTQLEGAAA